MVNEGGQHSLMILHAMVDDSAQYTCVARNISGEAHFSVNVTVEESDRITAPSFVQKLVNRQAKEGDSVTLQARAVGMPAPVMTWHKGARELFPGANHRIDTQNGVSTLVIHTATVGDSDWYQCTARNAAGTSSTKAKVSIEGKLQFFVPKPNFFCLYFGATIFSLFFFVVHLIFSFHSTAPLRDLTMPGGFYVPRVSRRPESVEPGPEAVNLRPVVPSYVKDHSLDGYGGGQEKPAFTSLLNDLELYQGDRAHFESCLIPIGDETLRVEWYV